MRKEVNLAKKACKPKRRFYYNQFIKGLSCVNHNKQDN